MRKAPLLPGRGPGVLLGVFGQFLASFGGPTTWATLGNGRKRVVWTGVVGMVYINTKKPGFQHVACFFGKGMVKLT